MSLVEYWDGPMSVAVEISDVEEQLPQFINTWLTTEKMRRNVDVHLVFNDHVKKNTKLFIMNVYIDLILFLF